MSRGLGGRLLGYVARFAIVHFLTYTTVALLFLAVMDALPTTERVTLDAYAPYRPIGLIESSVQFLRGVVLALVLFPFYGIIVRGRHGWIVILGALWGLAVLGSVEPHPGSFEGVIYVESTGVEHAAVLTASAAQVGLFAWFFLQWERRSALTTANSAERMTVPKRMPWGYLGRFTLLHVATYAVAGVFFYLLQDYEEAFATEAVFEHFRPLDHPLVAVAVPLQVLRGAILAACVFPFRGEVIQRRRGWLLLFLLLWGLTHVSSLIFIPDVVSSAAADGLTLRYFLLGSPEVTVQMFVFSWLVWRWERRASRRDEVGPAVLAD